MQYTPIINLKGQGFPFGSIEDETLVKYRKIFVKNRLLYKNQSEYQALQQKINALKKAHHKNFINIKSIQETQRGFIDIFYGYVHHKLSDASLDQDFSIKVLHEQLIKMIVHAAKHSILISFNSENCGLKIINGQKIVKYYFSLSEISICNDIKVIERSVQLFTVKSVQFLDELIFGQTESLIENGRIKDRRLSFSIKREEGRSCRNLPVNMFSERHLRNSVNYNYKPTETKRTQPMTNKTIGSTTNSGGISDTESTQKTRLQRLQLKISLQQSFAFRDEIKEKIQKLKQRSKRALQKLNLIRMEIARKVNFEEKQHTQKHNEKLQRLSLRRKVELKLGST